MKKIKKMLKKISTAIIVSFLAMPTAFGRTVALYGIPPAKPVKRVDPPKKTGITLVIIIPIIFVYGITVYLLNSKSSKERKARIAIFATLVVVVFCIGIYRYYMDPSFKDTIFMFFRKFF